MDPTLESQNRLVKILLVEDNPSDIFFLKEALQHSRYPISVDVAVNGAEALAYLRQEGEYGSKELPDVIILDLNLPRISGWVVLGVVRGDPRTRHIPVLVVSGFLNKEIRHRLHDSKQDYYLVKPIFLTKFPMLTRTLDRLLDN